MSYFQSGIEILLLLLEEYKKEASGFYSMIKPRDKDSKNVEFIISLINSADKG